MIHSILLKNAEIWNPADEEPKRADLYIEEGIVKRIAPGISCDAQYTEDISGYMVTPGLVDTHAHMFWNSELIGVDPQRFDLPKGVTYTVDQGSAGADNYAQYRKQVLFSTDVKSRAFLNCSRIGMPTSSLADTGDIPGPGELSNPDYLDRGKFIEVFETYRPELLGVKIRLTPNICPKNPLGALEQAISIAEELKVPVSVHPNHAAGLTTEDILSRLRCGDIFTHSFHDSHTGILDKNREIKPCVLEARKKGVIFDTGHGVNSLAFPVLEQALSLGFWPDTISTDLHNLNYNGPVFDLPTTISKFLCLGMPLLEAIRCCTVNPVRLLGLSEKSVAICEGQPADLAVFQLMKGDFTYRDAMKNTISGSYKLIPHLTVVGNKMFYNYQK